MLRYWNDVVSHDQAQSLVDSIAKVFTGFIESPSESISAAKLEDQTLTEQPSEWSSSQTSVSERVKTNRKSLDGTAIQKIIDDRVHEIIGQMLRDGKLMVPGLATDSLSGYGHPDSVGSPFQLEGLQGEADDSGVCSATSRSSQDGMSADEIGRAHV